MFEKLVHLVGFIMRIINVAACFGFHQTKRKDLYYITSKYSFGQNVLQLMK